MSMGSRSDRVAFVLSGGASLGAVQVGMVRALYERGIVPDLVVGTSVGAINGAFIASRPQTVETVDELAADLARRPARAGVSSFARSAACSASSDRAITSYPNRACAV